MAHDFPFSTSRECNCRSNVRHVLNEFYAAVMFHIYWIWKTECKTIKDSGFLIKGNMALTLKQYLSLSLSFSLSLSLFFFFFFSS